MDSFRALKLSNWESFRARKYSIKALKVLLSDLTVFLLSNPLNLDFLFGCSPKKSILEITQQGSRLLRLLGLQILDKLIFVGQNDN
jgi:hypothetical protein